MKPLTEILSDFAKYCSVQGTPFGSMPNDEPKLAKAKLSVRKELLGMVGEDEATYKNLELTPADINASWKLGVNNGKSQLRVELRQKIEEWTR